MDKAPHSSTTHGRRKLWMQIFAFLVFVALIWLRPTIESLVDGQNQKPHPEAGEQFADDLKPSREIEGSSPVSPASEESDIQVSPESADTATLGKLTEIRKDVFQSSGGLIYRSGSADGHRLKHVMQHARDNPQKKIHGVFDGDGDQEFVLAIIDEAFLKAKAGGQDVRSQRQNDRSVFTVNLRRRIGQVGGEEGQRKGHPECRYVRIVLENDNEVISAYPTSSF